MGISPGHENVTKTGDMPDKPPCWHLTVERFVEPPNGYEDVARHWDRWFCTYCLAEFSLGRIDPVGAIVAQMEDTAANGSFDAKSPYDLAVALRTAMPAALDTHTVYPEEGQP